MDVLKHVLSLLFLFSMILSEHVRAQPQQLQFKKGQKTKKQWWTGQEFTFQARDKNWRKGVLVRLTQDSFYISNRVVNYSPLGMDTMHLGTSGYAFTDVYALPKYGYPVDYVNGHYEVVSRNGGMHFYWIKSGYIFRLAAATYAGVWLVNGAIQHDLALQDSHLGIAAGVFAFGVLLNHLYKPYIIMKGKRHFMVIG
jgi:hypothetical protein